jgi:hypothetical protein
MEETQYPIWDRTGSYILTDNGQEMWMAESVVRRMISQQKLGVWRLRNSKASDRKIIIKDTEEAVFGNRLRRYPGISAQPYCVRVPVSDTHRAYMHVAERCEAAYDGRPMPKRYNPDGTVRRNEYGREVRISARISASYL